MSLSIHEISVPVFARFLGNLSAILDKGATHAQDVGTSPDALLSLRLTDDMLPLSRQVQIATDMAKNGVARLAGMEPPRMPDDETTLEQLQARIARVIEFVRGVDPAALEGAESREIRVPTSSAGELRLDGRTYLTGFALPNLYFHIGMAYALLRREGVPLGKLDFMAGLPKL